MEGEHLIEEVRKFPVLFDQSEAKYRNAEYKERVWKIISETLKAPGGGDECKKMWSSIRDQFRRSLQKRKTKSGQSAVKIQKYKYEDTLEFLLPHIVERETLSNAISLDSQRDDSEFDPRMQVAEDDPESELESQNEVSQNPGTSSQTAVQPTHPVSYALSKQTTPGKTHQFACPLIVKRRGSKCEKPTHESPSSQLMAFILAEKEAEKNRNNPTNRPEHPVDIFLAGLAPSLKSLDPVLLNQAKSRIFATVQEFELKQILSKEGQQQITTNSPATATASINCSSNSNSSNSSTLNESPHTEFSQCNSTHVNCSTPLLNL